MYTNIMHDIAMLASVVACFVMSVDTWKREQRMGEDTRHCTKRGDDPDIG